MYEYCVSWYIVRTMHILHICSCRYIYLHILYLLTLQMMYPAFSYMQYLINTIVL